MLKFENMVLNCKGKSSRAHGFKRSGDWVYIRNIRILVVMNIQTFYVFDVID